MQQHNVYLFFAKENEIEAQQIIKDLRTSKINCIAQVQTKEKVNQLVGDVEGTALLLVSDNYLKSIDETRHLEQILGDENISKVMPVLTHGRRVKNGTENQIEVYPTMIQTLNNVMHYRDFWYEEWINLRKQYRTAAGDEQEDLEAKKNIAKKMSVGSMTTYIRKLKGASMVEWEDFCDNSYQLLFDALGIAESQEERFSHEPQGEEPIAETPAPVEAVEEVPVDDKGADEAVIEEAFSEETVVEDAFAEEVELVTEAVEEVTEEEVVEEVVEEVPVDDKGADEAVIEEAFSEETVVEEVFAEEVELVTELVESPPAVVEEELMASAEVEAPVEEVAESPEVEEETEVTDEAVEAAFELGLESLDAVDAEAILDAHDVEEVNDIDVLFHTAESEVEEGDFDNGRHAYERILQLDPYNGRALIGLARLFAHHYDNEVQAAAQTYKKAIMFNDDNARLYYEFALLQKDAFKAYNKASDAFREALDIDNTFEDAYMGLAWCQHEMGMKDQAKANYLQACVLDSERFQTEENDIAFGVVRRLIETDEAAELEVEEMAMPQNPNANTVVLVTGATSGIGRSTAQHFIVNGYKVIVAGRRADRLEAFKTAMEEEFEETQIHCLPFDVANLEAVKTAVDSLPEGWSDIDVLVNNAGLAKGFGPIHEGDIEHWETMINTNVKGLLYMTRMITPNMVKRQTGHVINIGSVAGKQAYYGGAVYCATKAAVESLTRSMRLDLYQHNIKVSTVHPGHVEATEFAAVRYEDVEKAKIYEDFKPLEARDVAETIYYIATRPEHVNIQDVLMFGTQQASATDINRNGRG